MPRSPKHFKIHASIQNHPKTIGVYDDDALLAMYARIGIMAVERFADRTGDSYLASGRDLERLAGCQGVANARRKLGRLEASTRLEVGQQGAAWRLTLPNFAKKQGFHSRNGCEKENPSSSSPTSTSTSNKHTVDTAVSPTAARSPGGQSAALCPPQEALDRVESLSRAISESVPGQSVPTTDRAVALWAVHLDRLNRLGAKGGDQGFAWGEIDAVIEWLPTHDRPGFRWGLVVLSARKFRDHFPRMLAELRAGPMKTWDQQETERVQRAEEEFRSYAASRS